MSPISARTSPLSSESQQNKQMNTYNLTSTCCMIIDQDLHNQIQDKMHEIIVTEFLHFNQKVDWRTAVASLHGMQRYVISLKLWNITVATSDWMPQPKQLHSWTKGCCGSATLLYHERSLGQWWAWCSNTPKWVWVPAYCLNYLHPYAYKASTSHLCIIGSQL